MTTEEMLQVALQEFAGLSPDELEILYDHLGTRAHADLAQRVVTDATELWAPSEESGVEPKDWVREYIKVTIDLFHDQRQAFEMAQLRDEAIALVDELGADARALLLSILGTTQRTRVAFIVAKLVLDAISAGLVDGSDRRAAIKKTIEVHLEAHIEDVDSSYFAAPRRTPAAERDGQGDPT